MAPPDTALRPAGRQEAPALQSGDYHAPWRRGGSLPLDTSTREELISRYLPLVRVAVGKLATLLTLPFDPEDCHGPGALALIRAVDTFDPSRGVPFEAFAYPRIYGAMIDHLRARDWVPRGVRDAVQRLRRAYSQLMGRNGRPPDDEELAAHLSLSTRELGALVQRAVPTLVLPLEAADQMAACYPPRSIIPDADGSPSARLEHQELVGLMTEAIGGLNEAERTVIVFHYRKGLMFKDIASALGRSRARVSQLHSQALSKLKAHISRALEPKTYALAGGADEHG